MRSQLSPDAVGRRRPALRSRRSPMRVPAAGEIFFFNVNNMFFSSSLTQWWVRFRPDKRDVSTRHVMGYLEEQVTVFRSDGNDWVRTRSERIQTTFWGYQTTSFKIYYFSLSLTWNWVRSRSNRRDVSTRHVMGHLEGQSMVFRSDDNDWVRTRSDRVQIIFFGVLRSPKWSKMGTL